MAREGDQFSFCVCKKSHEMAQPQNVPFGSTVVMFQYSKRKEIPMNAIDWPFDVEIPYRRCARHADRVSCHL